jgi:hypothetical protein
MTFRGGKPWLDLVPPEGRAAIRDIVRGVEAVDHGHRGRWYYAWSVLCTPSCRQATDVVLICRGTYSERRWPIMQDGEVVADKVAA